ncbi:tripartite tricarboxylate transporter TctB family protein [Aquabacter spiritensis]|uniref:Tripartite tricarboxylate transporter TctB family protein n=1 Tax=Aquabacter spiritensis TaxID=933073 RepID=A0A4R3M4U3_9HYPH|nr:tripartite tricarboxylate transporter TctB family protein [Aquabacter spiritensis]TCT06215.1 tripartite tricarboxylate transporter TctB family protein [Aquabacter spiritensis]
MGRIWGLMFIAFGAVWMWDGWRLETAERSSSMFDDLGPDRYLVVLGLIMVAVGVALAVRPPPNLMKRDGGAAAFWPPRPPVTFTLAMVAYALIMPRLGYVAATFLFFILIFYLAGKRSVLANLGYGAVCTAVFYVIFKQFADMPLPTGLLSF